MDSSINRLSEATGLILLPQTEVCGFGIIVRSPT